MTIKQMQTTMETMRSICGPKNKLTDEQIDGKFNKLCKKHLCSYLNCYRIKKRRIHRRQRFKVLHIMCCTNGRYNEEKWNISTENN